MESTILRNGVVVKPLFTTAGTIAIREGRIADIHPERIRAGRTIDCKGLRIFPGFIDVHNHGAVGVDVNSADVDGLTRVGAFLAANGVTAWMPTLVPDSDENYARAVAAAGRKRRNRRAAKAWRHR
jgi:N-acetylglucosamine-6-phosphate deacetylase